MLYAVLVVGFPESYAEPFLEEVVGTLGYQRAGRACTVKKSQEPTHAHYSIFMDGPYEESFSLARRIAERLRRYMTGRGNPSDAGSYRVTVALMDTSDEDGITTVDQYDEALLGYL